MYRKLLYLLAGVSLLSTTYAQIAPDGTVMSKNVVITDMQGNAHDLYEYTSQGKHVVLDFFRTLCGFCWAHHNAGYFNDYYLSYGAPGTISDVMVIGFEVDQNSTDENVRGTGNTLGDWTKGVDYPIANETDQSKIYNAITTFIPSGSFGTPALVLVCSDRSFYKLTTSMNADAIRAAAQSKCGNLSLEEIRMPGSISYIGPNPSGDYIDAGVVEGGTPVQLAVFNSLGQKMKAESMRIGQGVYRIETRNWEEGIYILKVEAESGSEIRRFIVRH